MQKIILIAILVASTFATLESKDDFDQLPTAQECDPNTCKLPECLCSSINPPGGLNPEEIPQTTGFEDSVTRSNDDYNKIFDGRTNPDGCPVGSTYFLSHEYTDYSLVHDLWTRGHEIVLHSIGSEIPWHETTVEEFMREYADQVDLINKFAKIPKEDMIGVRLRGYQTSGNNSFEMMTRAGLKYDSSFTYYHQSWPYAMDHEGFPGVWVVPQTMWRDLEGLSCAMIDACRVIPKEESELVKFMIDNFNRHYINGTRLPFGFYMHTAWFMTNPIHFSAYIKFLDYLQGLSDVYVVSIQRALQWIKNPSTLDNLQESWPQCQALHENTCEKVTCVMPYQENEIRVMVHCDEKCPACYPSLGNPLGLAPGCAEN